MPKTAVILAGGFGTRLRNVVSDLPKPMAPVNGEPFLNYLIRYLKHYQVNTVVLSTGYLSEKIEVYYKNEFEGVRVVYSIEKEPLGTGGGIRLALEKCEEENVFVLNGDSFFEIDLFRFNQLHQQQLAQTSLALRKVQDASRYGTIEKDHQHRIVSFKEKNNYVKEGLINGGTYLLNKSLFMEHTPAAKNFSIEKDFFEKHSKDIVLKGFEFDSYFIDIGIPEDYAKAQNDFKGFKFK